MRVHSQGAQQLVQSAGRPNLRPRVYTMIMLRAPLDRLVSFAVYMGVTQVGANNDKTARYASRISILFVVSRKVSMMAGGQDARVPAFDLLQPVEWSPFSRAKITVCS